MNIYDETVFENILCVAFAEVMPKDDVEADMQVDAARELIKELAECGYVITRQASFSRIE